MPDENEHPDESTESKGNPGPRGEKKKEEPEEEEPKDTFSYGLEGAPSEKITYDSDKGFDAPEKKTERKIAYEHEWGNKEGYLVSAKTKGEAKYGSGSAEIGLGYGMAKASSGLSYNLNEKEVSLNVINAKVQISVVHAKVKGKFKLGAWLSSLFSSDEQEPAEKPVENATEGQGQTGIAGMGALMAARVGDLTGHGSPLAPGIGSTNVFIGNMPAWRTVMDFHACPIVKGLIPDIGGVVMVGSPTVFINFMMACRISDMVVEIPGGPNPIAMGCPTVFIGPASGGGAAAGGGGGDGGGGGGTEGGGKEQEKKKESEGVTLDASGEGDLLTAGAEGSAGAVFSKERRQVQVKASAMAAVAKGKIEGGLTIPLPWGHSIRFSAGATGSAVSLGIEGHAEAGWTAEEGAHASWGLGAALGLGASLDFGIGIK